MSPSSIRTLPLLNLSGMFSIIFTPSDADGKIEYDFTSCFETTGSI
jgi:hypothetical protein